MAFTLIIIFGSMLLAVWAQARVKGTYAKWKEVRTRSHITGRQAAAYVMKKAGIYDVDIVAIPGQLTDHYDPINKRLALSEENFYGESIAAVGVAAHEAGHAIQHKVSYPMLNLRMSLVPMTNIASRLLPIVIFGGFVFHLFGLVYLGAAVYGVLTLFQLVTLPVEFNATARAKKELVGLGILESDEMLGVNQTLNAAAWTYVAAFVSSLGYLLHYLMIIIGNRD